MDKQNGGRELEVPENNIISAADFASVDISTDKPIFSWALSPMGQLAASCNIR